MTVGELIKALQECPNMDAAVEFNPDLIPTPTGEADTELWSSTAHGLLEGEAVEILSLTGGAGIAVGVFYVRGTNLSANAFELSASAPDPDGTEGAIAAFTTDVTAAAIVRRSPRSVVMPDPASLPADAPDAALVDPGIAVVS